MIGPASIDVATWRRIRRPIHEALYEIMVEGIECGPFDGGCVLFARALRDVVEGEVHVVVRPDGRADHAAVLLDGRLWDWDGPTTPRRFLARFNRAEMTRCVAWRPFREGDLPNAPLDDVLQTRISDLLKQVLDTSATRR